jgi:Holliday junction DNA helicase RuvB
VLIFWIIVEGGDREGEDMARPPKILHEFIGQRRVIQYLVNLITGAKVLGRPCLSILLIAPSGAGKSTLARAVATEYGSDLYPVLAGDDLRVADLCEILYQQKHGDVLFIDEAHSLNRDAQQVLYEAVGSYKAPALSEGRVRRARWESIAAFTLILATNEPASLKQGLLTRLHHIEFDPYTIPELKAIAECVAMQEEFKITPQAARRLAEVAQGMPRSICHRLEALRLLYPYVFTLTLDHIRDLLIQEGIDDRGFSPHQRRYLMILAESPGGQCSLEGLAIQLGFGGTTAYVRQHIEPYLIHQGLVDPHSVQGRRVTPLGRSVIADMPWVRDMSNPETAHQEALP